MTTPVLYSFRRCPYAIRARMTLSYSALSVRLREVVLRDKPPCMLTYSPKGTVPVMVLADNTILEESLDIMLWALAQHDPQDWLMGGSGKDFDAAIQLIHENDFTFKPDLDRYKYGSRHPDEDCREARDRACEFLEDLDRRLSLRRNLFRDAHSFADTALFPFVRQFAHVDREWFFARPYPDLIAWLHTNLQSPLFLGVMNRYSQWQAGDPEVPFPESEIP